MSTMEELRLQGNKCFATDLLEASKFYLQAAELYEANRGKDPQCTLEEFTKSAGNALTCLFKMDETEACAALAKRVLALNPILAKANAFYGRCALADPSLDVAAAGYGTASASALMHLCRAIYQLPALEESTRDNIEEAITRLMQEQLSVYAQFSQSKEPGVRIVGGRHGTGVEAIRVLPPFIEVASLRVPFSVGAYEEFGGKGCCVECGQAIEEAEMQTSTPAPADSDEDALEATQPAATTNLSCPRCDMIAYCSTDCAVAHGEQHVKYECARMQKLKEMMGGITARGIDAPEQFYELAYHCITTVAGLRSQRIGYERVLGLSSHVDEVIQSLHPIGPLMCDLFRNEEPPPTLYTVIGVLRCNALELSGSSGLGVGQGLHIGKSYASFYNHSCAPNCAIDAMRRRIITTRTINPGEELTIAYLPQLYWPTKLRQERLSENFFFFCRCQRCVAGEKEPFEAALRMELLTARSDATHHYHGKVQLRCSAVRARSVDEVTEKDASELETLLAELQHHFFPFHYLCHEVRNCLSFVYAVLGNSPRCLSCCLDELLLWECILPGALPVKQLKLQNALQCAKTLDSKETCSASLFPHLSRLAILYEVAESV